MNGPSAVSPFPSAFLRLADFAARGAALPALLATLAYGPVARAQEAPAPSSWAEAGSDLYSGIELRHIGPALMSGRIADIAIHPEQRSTWYVAVGSGGVWKTTNAGTTFEPIFDREGSYSIGCVTIDPNEPQVVWVGTGENVSGRHVGYGDGVYRSLDGGATWQNLGLRDSEHVSRILVDPRDSNVVYVAAEGPLWSAGGERGVFKSTDRGESWSHVLDISEDTGVASLELDPKDPDILYAAAYQRRRTVWSLLAGGPESGIYKSTDAGASWREVTRGLPEGPMGKIGLAVSPFDPELVYATIEAKGDEAGFYRSEDGGETWERRNAYHSGGTGPHYYQEIFASPHARDRVYQMDVFFHVTEDGGRTFRQVDGGADKHSDNHAMAFVESDPRYLLLGTDAGIYESFDLGSTWKFVTSLPVTQIYKASVDDGFPSYRMIGGTQDNGTIEGPARTFNRHGIRDQDWTVPYGADGYDTAVDPEDPNVFYVSWQGGHPLRFDRRTGELVDIQPQPEPLDPPERFNWDAPILVSPHQASRLYYGSHRLWRSDDRGDSWTAISRDLTRGETRYELPVAGRIQSLDALWGNSAMSWYATLTSITESPLVAGLLYTGSDDGSIQVSEDGGATWRRSELPGDVPERAFVNQIRASLHDADTVYAVLDNHKEGDYRPYLLVSDDRARTWRSMSGDLQDRQILWAIAQDHEREDLFFLAAELGVYFTLDGGEHWIRLAGAPHLAFRDLEIQRRENDLVAASFGRGFYVLDDYSPLRELEPAMLGAEATLFPVRRAFWFHPVMLLQNSGKGSKGTDYYTAPNPPFGATFTYFLSEGYETPAEARRAREESFSVGRPSGAWKGEDVPVPTLEELRAEERAEEPVMLLVVRDTAGAVVRRIEAPATKGFHRVAWDLRYPPFDPITLEQATDLPPWADPPAGPMAPPGSYTVELARLAGAELETLSGPVRFEVEEIFDPSLPAQDAAEVLTFQQQTGELYHRALAAARELGRARERLDHLEKAIVVGPQVDLELLGDVRALRSTLDEIAFELRGDLILGRLEEPSPPSVLDRLQTTIGGHWSSRHGPTESHRRGVEIAREALDRLLPMLASAIEEELPSIEGRVEEAGGRYTPGRRIPIPPAP
ncbi:MAG TPA: glycosyl hydrolase [Thermoanaerobaculia bacterium]|nr:glycosyl hydrolase [Thermoanaerobaculia bacterium]